MTNFPQFKILIFFTWDETYEVRHQSVEIVKVDQNANWDGSQLFLRGQRYLIWQTVYPTCTGKIKAVNFSFDLVTGTFVRKLQTATFTDCVLTFHRYFWSLTCKKMATDNFGVYFARSSEEKSKVVIWLDYVGRMAKHKRGDKVRTKKNKKVGAFIKKWRALCGSIKKHEKKHTVLHTKHPPPRHFGTPLN